MTNGNKLLLMILGGFAVLWAIFSSVISSTGSNPCEEFSNTPISQVPARCVVHP